jgi:hypothetical protein
MLYGIYRPGTPEELRKEWRKLHKPVIARVTVPTRIGGIVRRIGLEVVLPGNTADNTTRTSFLKKIEARHGKAQRVGLMDRGIPTEAVLEQMRASDPPRGRAGQT